MSRKKQTAVVKEDVSSVSLRPEHAQEMATIALLLEHHHEIMLMLERQRANTLRIAYGIDVTSGEWRFDPLKGEVTREPAAVSPQPAE